MKTMQDFYESLSVVDKEENVDSSVNQYKLPNQHHLVTLKQFSRAQISSVSNQTTWFIWSDEKPKPSKKSPDER